MTSVRLNPAGMCIYCGKKRCELTLEHVIPASLSGRIKLPEATCEDCQTIINSQIEGRYVPLVIGPHREKYGLKSKRTPINAISYPVTFRYASGFEEEVYVRSEDFPNAMVHIRFEAPPFLSTNARTLSKCTLQADEVKSEDIKNLIRIYRPDATGISLTLHAQHDQFIRLLYKIATGLLFDVSPQSVISAGLGQRVLDNPKYLSSGDGAPAEFEGIFSIPLGRSVKATRSTSAEVFEICEEGKRFLYAAFHFLPKLNKHTYYIRIPSLMSGQLIHVAYEKKRRMTLRDVCCDIATQR